MFAICWIRSRFFYFVPELGCKLKLLSLPTTRRKFLKLAAAAGVTALTIDTALLEPNRPHIVRKDVRLKRWPSRLDGFTIALLSDFHYDAYFSVHPLRAAIDMVNGLSPDLIVLTGDFVSAPLIGSDQKASAAAEPCARLIRQMHAPHGLWAILGNHDYSTDPAHVAAVLRSEGIHVLENQSAAIEHDGTRFWLAGVNDVFADAADLDKTLHGVPSSEATVLLAHEPDYADYVAKFPVDLQLSGHSHGGQVRLPLVLPLYLPELARKYVLGMYHIGPLTLYTNAGLGTVNLPVRFNCPPEITLLTVRQGWRDFAEARMQCFSQAGKRKIWKSRNQLKTKGIFSSNCGVQFAAVLYWSAPSERAAPHASPFLALDSFRDDRNRHSVRERYCAQRSIQDDRGPRA
jgi:uncharacterized protein